MKAVIAGVFALALAGAPALAEGCAYLQRTAEQAPVRYVSHHVEGNIVEVAQAAGQFETLIAAARAAGLADALTGEGPLTVFAPTDAAFAALPEGTVASLLLPENKDQLVAVLQLHVIAGAKVTSDQLAGAVTEAETLGGTVTIDGTDGVTVNGINVVSADVMASNGVIHVIDQVILPH